MLLKYVFLLNFSLFFQSYPDLLSQSIYSAFCAAFPNSWRQFDDKFKSDICTLTHQWIVGTRPMPNLWENWDMPMLEPKDMRKEVLMKKDSKKSKNAILIQSGVSQPFL